MKKLSVNTRQFNTSNRTDRRAWPDSHVLVYANRETADFADSTPDKSHSDVNAKYNLTKFCSETSKPATRLIWMSVSGSELWNFFFSVWLRQVQSCPSFKLRCNTFRTEHRLEFTNYTSLELVNSIVFEIFRLHY